MKEQGQPPLSKRRRRISPAAGCRGFTLMEVTVALAILALLLSLVYQAFVRTIRSQEIVSEDAMAYHAARVILDRLHYELTNTYIRRESLFVIADESALSSRRRRSRRNRSRFRKKQESEDSQTVFIGRHNGDSQTPLDTLIFTTTANFVFTPDARESDLVEVIYYPVEDRETGEIVLRRREYKMPVGDVDVEREDCTAELHCTDFVVYRGIRGIGFRYYTDDRFGDRFDQDEWDSTSARDEEQYNRVPRAVEITLVLESSAGTDLLFRTIVAVPAGFATGRK